MNGLFDSTTGEGLAESGWLLVFINSVLAAFLDPVRMEIHLTRIYVSQYGT
jgi:hypothetical protein